MLVPDKYHANLVIDFYFLAFCVVFFLTFSPSVFRLYCNADFLYHMFILAHKKRYSRLCVRKRGEQFC